MYLADKRERGVIVMDEKSTCKYDKLSTYVVKK